MPQISRWPKRGRAAHFWNHLWQMIGRMPPSPRRVSPSARAHELPTTPPALKTDQARAALTDFKRAFCEHYECSDAEFLPRCLWMSFDRVWRPIVFLLWHLRRDYFGRDLRYLELIGGAPTWSEVVFLANRIPSDPLLNRGWLRQRLHLRISGSQVLKLRQAITRVRMAACV